MVAHKYAFIILRNENVRSGVSIVTNIVAKRHNGISIFGNKPQKRKDFTPLVDLHSTFPFIHFFLYESILTFILFSTFIHFK